MGTLKGARSFDALRDDESREKEFVSRASLPIPPDKDPVDRHEPYSQHHQVEADHHGNHHQHEPCGYRQKRHNEQIEQGGKDDQGHSGFALRRNQVRAHALQLFGALLERRMERYEALDLQARLSASSAALRLM